MKIGLIGLKGAGKSTIFEALTLNIANENTKAEDRIGTVEVPDERVDFLSKIYNPKKTIYAKIQYYLAGNSSLNENTNKEHKIWTNVKDCDALIHVVRNFNLYGYEKPEPFKDFFSLNQDLIFYDFAVVEKRLERIELDKKRGKPISNEEVLLLHECFKHLEKGLALRKFSSLSDDKLLRGYTFVSGKPIIVLFNNDDDDDNMPANKNDNFDEDAMLIRGKLENELAQMSKTEAEDFFTEFNITELAMTRVIKQSYTTLGLISFFTVGEDEVRAWTIKKNTTAIDAAEVIHSDIKKGFIRAEVLAYKHFVEAGSYQEAKKRGTARLEGKTYIVEDGDIINFRFNI
ncbi:MAG: redox-regulated ATPase YchF [Desulfobacterales bacterium]|nr:redox-regulated ATPase YchF [Desulfobacterales bacterium]